MLTQKVNPQSSREGSVPDDDFPHRILRLSDEPGRYWSDRRVHEKLSADPAGFIRFMTEGVRAVADGSAQIDMPPKQIFADRDADGPGGGDFRIMPCVLRWGERHWKTVKVVGTNNAQRIVPDKITVGKALALHPVENFVTDILDACILSAARTGACAAIGASALAAPRESVAIVGSGRVGYYSALYLCAQGGVAKLAFHDVVEGRAAHAAQALAAIYPHTEFSARSGDPDADLAVIATTSTEPLLHPAGTRAVTVISLGADTDDQRELDPAWRQAADLYVESVDSLRYGDLKNWGVSPVEVTELSRLFTPGKQAVLGRSVFISTGSALFDNLAIGYLLEHAASTGS
jgi:ornithine cyclodeaminase/alanine dehydrogenase-like protein (mu-crystallin family)